jgi:tripartite-type tricarboxylate transporter receptor subunit TctC
MSRSTRGSSVGGLPASGPGYESSLWNGIGAPKATPAQIVDKLNHEIIAALADTKFNRAARWLSLR